MLRICILNESHAPHWNKVFNNECHYITYLFYHPHPKGGEGNIFSLCVSPRRQGYSGQDPVPDGEEVPPSFPTGVSNPSWWGVPHLWTGGTHIKQSSIASTYSTVGSASCVYVGWTFLFNSIFFVFCVCIIIGFVFKFSRYSGSLNKNNFNIPSNVKFMSWLPQNDLLAHNKTKLFITHGGINGRLFNSSVILFFIHCGYLCVFVCGENSNDL